MPSYKGVDTYNMSRERLSNFYNARLNEYNKRIDVLNARKDIAIEKLQDEIQDEEEVEERRILNAELRLQEELETATSRTQRQDARTKFRLSKLQAKRIKGRNIRKLNRTIRRIERRHPERLLNDTKSSRQKMYTLKTWAEKYRTEKVVYRSEQGFRGRRVWVVGYPFRPVDLPATYPTQDIKTYESNGFDRCTTDWINPYDIENRQKVEVCIE